MRALRHDMRNHLSALLGLLERGSWEEAERYLRQLGGSPALTGAFSSKYHMCRNILVKLRAASPFTITAVSFQ